MAEAAVVGASDAMFGQVPVAYVVLRGKGSVSSEALIQYCREHVARYKVPREIVYLDAMPRNAKGKVEKKKLPLEKHRLGPSDQMERG